MQRWMSSARAAAGVLVLTALVAGTGCGLIADKDRIKVAKIGDRFITRGDLNLVIRSLPEEERPIIDTQGDVLIALQDYIDRELKTMAAEQLEAEGKIHVPREQAAAQFDATHPEFLMQMSNPADYGLTEADVRYQEEEREIQIDRTHQKMLGEQAVYRLVQEAVTDGTMVVTDEEFAEEYEIRRFELLNFEQTAFRGLYFPDRNPESIAMAAQVVNRLKAGESMDVLAAEYTERGGGVLDAALMNDPELGDKVKAFWEQASRAVEGSVIGPVFISGWKRQIVDVRGRVTEELLPDAYLVCLIIEYTPESQKSFEDAKAELEVQILYAKMMARLRERNGVEIYEDKLPDPVIFSTPGSVFAQ